MPLFGFGFGGILIMAFVKMNDINNLCDDYTFKDSFGKFIGREWPSYGLAIVIVFLSALSHEEWLPWFQGDGKLAKLAEVPLGVKLSMTGWGALGQYFIYKKFGKMKTAGAINKLDEKKAAKDAEKEAIAQGKDSVG